MFGKGYRLVEQKNEWDTVGLGKGAGKDINILEKQ